MNQSVTALNGAGTLLDIGTPVTPMPAGAAVSSDGAGDEASFGLMIAKAATGQSVDAGNSVPQDGESLPSGQAETVGVVTEGGGDQGAGDDSTTPQVLAAVTPELIGEYRKADISVAVGSVLQQYREGVDGQQTVNPNGGALVQPLVETGVERAAAMVDKKAGASPVVTVVAVPQRGEADIRSERQAPVDSALSKVQAVADERIAAIESMGRTTEKPGRQSSEQLLAEQRSVLQQSTATAGVQGSETDESANVSPVVTRNNSGQVQLGSSIEHHAPVSPDVPVSGKAAGHAVAEIAGKTSEQESSRTPGEVAAKVDAGLTSVVVAQPAVVPLQKEQGDPAASANTSGVLQAVADRLKSQLQPAAAVSERSLISSEQGPSSQPINRETAQVIGESRPESARPMQQTLEAVTGLRNDVSGDLKGRDQVAGSLSDLTGSVKAEAAGPDKALSGFAESLAMAGKSSKSTADMQNMTMPNGLKPGMPGWSQAVNNRVMMLSSQNGRFAEIQLDPPELGSLQVKLQVKNEQVSVVFSTPHAVVKDALEQGMPRLREMFEQQGMSLADSSVEDQSQGQQSEGDGERGYASAGTAGPDMTGEAESASRPVGEAVSLVDYYA